MACRVNRRRVWTARIVLESLAFNESSFVTLTYDESNIPSFGSLSNKHWREFTKGIGYRYFGCGEYGDHSQRPHYHLVIFGLSPVVAEDFCRSRWPYGFVSVRPFCQAHASYVAAYTTKKLTKVEDVRLKPGQIPEFARMSRRPAVGCSGIGSFGDWLVTREGAGYLARTRDVPAGVRLNGKVFPLGRTMRLKLREACDIPSDDPVRRMASEADFRAARSSPAKRDHIERLRVSRYERLRSLNMRRRGVI